SPQQRPDTAKAAHTSTPSRQPSARSTSDAAPVALRPDHPAHQSPAAAHRTDSPRQHPDTVETAHTSTPSRRPGARSTSDVVPVAANSRPGSTDSDPPRRPGHRRSASASRLTSSPHHRSTSDTTRRPVLGLGRRGRVGGIARPAFPRLPLATEQSRRVRPLGTGARRSTATGPASPANPPRPLPIQSEVLT
ncbi:MAG TPA: hypothetical protein VNO31_52095, partial [Umezawaea sp.]|nr:hypothetical protein [Umezawaea sp.]